jgi:chromosome partitioning protein
MDLSLKMARRDLTELVGRAQMARGLIQDSARAPNERKEPIVFSANRAAELLGKSRQSVCRVIRDLDLCSGQSGGVDRWAIDMNDFDQLRLHYGIEYPHRARGVSCAVLNQKGGVAKTTTTAGLATWLAIQGARVAVIDVDSQASFTEHMGLTPDAEIDVLQTIAPAIIGLKDADLSDRLMQATHLERLSFVPACGELASANEIAYVRTLTGTLGESAIGDQELDTSIENYQFYKTLQHGIEPLRAKFDVILLDCPPQISALTYAALCAADMVVAPLNAEMLSFASTLRFIEWIDRTISTLGHDSFRTLRFLITNYHTHNSPETERFISDVLGERLLKARAVHSVEVQRAATLLKTIYEVPQALGSRSAWARATRSFDEVNTEISGHLQAVSESINA